LKRQLKAQKFKDLADAVTCLRRGKPPERLNNRAKDGSIPVKPSVKSEVPESTILQEVLDWLRRHHIKANRLNNGAHQDASGFHFYGIPGAGDVVGLLPSGRHFEVETKSGRGGRLSIAQQKRMKDIQDNNGLYFVVCSVTELEQCFAEQVSDEEMQQVRAGETGDGLLQEEKK
jgi:hypothetical protein